MEAGSAWLEKEVGNEKIAWKASACRNKIIRFMKDNAPQGGWKIDPGQRNKDGRERKQLAVFLDIVDYLQEKAGEKEIALYARDPIIKDTDRRVLAAFNISVTESRSAESTADPGSFHYVAMWDQDEVVPAKKPTLFIGRPYSMVEGQANGLAEGGCKREITKENQQLHKSIKDAEKQYARMEICEGMCEHRQAQAGKKGRIAMSTLWLWCKTS
ncbi:Hypothetical predicted protein [Lecanosticta acicola]|uniref:SRR1-like domain-containing protein n=1 Tax=Lecanosticta acicola TaxID=111012 RepID=A0AAI9EE31_9PEZI|nr:Hypothetical predicted protein [Lecanosticta acicola]